MADCIGLREFRIQEHCGDDFGDNYPIMEKPSVVVSEGIGMGD